MTSTLCGHEREALISALRLFIEADRRGDNTRASHAVTSQWSADLRPIARDLDDPAKLAELMAAGYQKCGFWAFVAAEGVWSPPDAHMGPYFQINWRVRQGHILVSLLSAGRALAPASEYTLPQARAALLRLMQLPEGTPEPDVLRALEVPA